MYGVHLILDVDAEAQGARRHCGACGCARDDLPFFTVRQRKVYTKYTHKLTQPWGI